MKDAPIERATTALSTLPTHVHGIDFSGAVDAGQKIWIASGVVRDDTLRIDSCARAASLPNSGKDRELCLAALRDFIARQHASVIGMDFPFGLPQPLVEEDTWEAFVQAFPARYPDASSLRETCLKRAGGELKRATDRENHTPFSAYNIRLYRQTYFGIRDVLGPLVRDHLVCVLPMQEAKPGRPWVVEICPASTLKREGLYLPYKGKSPGRHANRRRILEAIEERGLVLIPDQALRKTILDDSGGDALDSVVAALAAFRALRSLEDFGTCIQKLSLLEGHIFV